MSTGGLSAELDAIEQAGHDLGVLADALDRTLRRAARALQEAEHRVGSPEVAAELSRLSAALRRTGRQSSHALGVFGQQVGLAAHTYRETDQDLAHGLRDPR